MPEIELYPSPFDVPRPPMGTLWDDHLRWCVFVMNKGDPQRHFAASCLTWVLKTGGLTEKQSAACSKMFSRIMGLYEAGALECQGEFEDDPVDANILRRVGMH